METCEWSYSETESIWESACGDAWNFEEGTPEDNHMKFCPFCGRQLTQRAADVCPDGKIHEFAFDDDDNEVCVECGTRR